MPIIIDTNTIPSVFSISSSDHEDFKPVLEWIINGKGLMVFGGSKYLAEVGKMTKYTKILSLLRTYKKVHIGCQTAIDKLEKEINKTVSDEDFDDPHLPAITINTKCRLICSKDKRSVKFVTDSSLYPGKMKAPSYYTGKRNKKLLSEKYVDDELKPLCKMKIVNQKTISAIVQ